MKYFKNGADNVGWWIKIPKIFKVYSEQEDKRLVHRNW
jgi:hypothetical protein